MKIYGRTFLAAVCCLTVVLVAGCAGLPPAAKQETLEERVNRYMKAQVERKWDQAYSVLHASYREKVSREDYVQRTRKVSYKGYSIEEITVLPSGNEATVKVRIDLLFMGAVFPRAPEKQNWVREKGEWFMKSSDKTTNPSERTTPFTQQKTQQ